jgi:hypothetical protein
MEGCWHLYWVDVSGEEIHRAQAETRRAWYAHCSRNEELAVVYEIPGSACTVTTSRRGSLPWSTGLSRVLAASGWISRPTIRWARPAEDRVLVAGATHGARDA